LIGKETSSKLCTFVLLCFPPLPLLLSFMLKLSSTRFFIIFLSLSSFFIGNYAASFLTFLFLLSHRLSRFEILNFNYRFMFNFYCFCWFYRENLHVNIVVLCVVFFFNMLKER
jgi:hypothetical protein